MRLGRIYKSLLLVFVATLVACGGGGGGPTPNTAAGNLQVTFAYAGMSTAPVRWESIDVSPTLYGIGANTPHFTLAQGQLPPGTTLNASTGAISGMLTESGSYSAVIRLTVDGFSGSLDAPISIAVGMPLCGYFPNPVIVGTPITIGATLSTLPASATVSYRMTGGVLAPGMSFSPATGVISGTPTAIGSYNAAFECVIDWNGTTTTLQAPMALYVVDLGISFSYAEFQGNVGLGGNLGTVQGIRPLVGGSLSGYTVAYRVKAGESLPSGFTLDPSTGIVSGLVASVPVYATTTIEMVLVKNSVTYVLSWPLVFNLQ